MILSINTEPKLRMGLIIYLLYNNGRISTKTISIQHNKFQQCQRLLKHLLLDLNAEIWIVHVSVNLLAKGISESYLAIENDIGIK